MSHAQILDYAQMCLLLVLRLSLIPIIVATVVGLIVSLLQALTQIQEQTLGFAVKLIAISLTLLVCASWIGSSLLLYTQDIFAHFALLR
ncbi:MAG: type III secretion system export apparatus subunit SctS [Kiritimatiellae bacterium]|nr:type III secretion system export apparatus subunit SctS [Kiritimatiellia bacterium]